MKRLLSSHLSSRPVLREFLSFCCVGVLNTTIDFGLYFIGTRFFHLHYLVAHAIAFTASASNSFILNRRFTFRHKAPDTARQFLRFLSVLMLSLVWEAAILYSFVELLHWHDLLAKSLVIAMGISTNFLGSKYWAFKKPKLITQTNEG